MSFIGGDHHDHEESDFWLSPVIMICFVFFCVLSVYLSMTTIMAEKNELSSCCLFFPGADDALIIKKPGKVFFRATDDQKRWSSEDDAVQKDADVDALHHVFFLWATFFFSSSIRRDELSAELAAKLRRVHAWHEHKFKSCLVFGLWTAFCLPGFWSNQARPRIF